MLIIKQLSIDPVEDIFLNDYFSWINTTLINNPTWSGSTYQVGKQITKGMATATEYYPPVGFHFRVEFQDIESQTIDTYFQEVSGLSFDIESETVKEGGENRFSYQLPTRAKYPNLVLKRGLLTDSSLISWINDTVETMEVDLATVIVTLLNDQHQPLQSYRCVNAWPKKWSVSSFNAEDNKLVIETLELVYQYYRIQ